MFCNTPGNGSDDHALMTQTIVLDLSETEMMEHGDQSWSCDASPGTIEFGCKQGICQTDWKPQRQEQA